MASPSHHFFCLDPRKEKRKRILQTLGPVGPIQFLRAPPLSMRDFPETAAQVSHAITAAKHQPRAKLVQTAKRLLLCLQYNGTRRLFTRSPEATAVVWNGLNGT